MISNEQNRTVIRDVRETLYHITVVGGWEKYRTKKLINNPALIHQYIYQQGVDLPSTFQQASDFINFTIIVKY